MGNVHRPALALARSGGATGIFGPQLPQRNALGQMVVKAAVDGDEIIVRAKRGRHRGGDDFLPARRIMRRGDPARSEEHTSELQSLMRISYAVFCLKKKTQAQNN